jgi:hypothetical protein
LLQQGVISHSNSAFASPVLLVKKGDKHPEPNSVPVWRLVIDYRHLNTLTVKGKYPLPVIDELLDELSGAQWFSKLDLRAGYHQIRLAPGEEAKTAFQTHNGHYEFKVMAFGLTGAPATFQFAMNASLAPVFRKFALVFFDDILIYSETYEEHMTHLKEVLAILLRDQWKAKLAKCAFAQQRIAYLGHVIFADGVSTDESKIIAIRDWPVPTTLKELRGFLGLSGYYRKFIKHYAIISQPLTALLKKGVLFVWTPAATEAFSALKLALITAPVLALPDYKAQFVIETDACEVGIGAVLSQKGHPLAFVSRALGPRNKGLSVYEKEYLAILLAVQQWHLQMGEFLIHTDHKSLVHLTDQRLHTEWQQKAFTKMMGLQYQVVYKKGALNGAADALSRKPPNSSEVYSITQVQLVWIEQVVESYRNDPFAQETIQKLAVDALSAPHFSLSSGVLRYDSRIWVGNDTTMQQQLIAAFHDSPLGGHSGFPVTYRRLVSLFKWTGMKATIREYVRACRICQQAKPERVLPLGLLQPLPVPSAPWEMATMDFIDGLPQSRQFNCILVVVDKLSNKFWQHLFHATGTQLRLSTANHPETDGQTERVNQSIECYLRCFISAHPNQWSKWLSLCEFWYNTNWHSSLGKSPFEVIYGRSPRYFGITATSSIASTDIQQWLDARQLILASVRQHLLRMQQRMKHQADKHRSERTFAVSDLVFLKLQPYLQSTVVRRGNQKLSFKFFGPFRILERVGTVAYKLALPETSRVHPVFHVSQLKQCLGPNQQVQPNLPSSALAFQVPVQVLQRRVRQHGLRTVVEGLIQWSGATAEDATCEDLVFLKQQFPYAPAWGQAGFQDQGNVSVPAVRNTDAQG